ncbi:Phosphoenolpyruvate synthase [Sulfidibacter corallicola]|uniref:Phosphoenolpyruvate synthase n=1 Tax=Sulfidibacter corallicola TaxID=2818388 RepID=A0A8A4U4G9_SULCO|nr:phosphoenolpyruvate synthase [Sulfidibacter corallicola]QTD53645.1 phosphoenolpyruvate synthase [Sulfidibacter corallicola]
MNAPEDLVLGFHQIRIDDLPRVGGKNASLGEMFCALRDKGIAVPEGFAVTAHAYRRFIIENDLQDTLQAILAGLEPENLADLKRKGRQLREAIMAGRFSDALNRAILDAYRDLCGENGFVDVAVRSSATAEDLPTASFAGQQETYLNVVGEAALLDACKRCFASLFTDRAISYRHEQGFDSQDVALSIGVQRMVRSDKASSGVMFTLDPESGFRDLVVINGAWGLGENVVQGAVTPDEFQVFKPTLLGGFRPILRKKLGRKELELVYAEGGAKMVRQHRVSSAKRATWCLADDEILQLARWGCLIEEHYSAKHGHPTPMDIEWAKDGLTGQLYVVQARPETVRSQGSQRYSVRYALKEPGEVLVSGKSVGEWIGAGKAHVIRSVADLDLLQPGEVLVTEKTDPDWEPALKRAAAVVTDRGGRTCHAAIVSRELGIPAIVGTGNGTGILATGQEVTVSCAEGEVGHVYRGLLDIEATRIREEDIPKLQTKVMMNLADPDKAFSWSFLPNDGVGLARIEFIINNQVHIHPMALVGFDRIQDLKLRRRIERLTNGYADKRDYFIDRLAQGMGSIAAAFFPKEVIVRLSDFKTNEYAHLIGGELFEPEEENPMLGWRGASRYYDPRYRDGFGLECRAVKRVREDMGLNNLKVMIPFCRTVEEGEKVLAEMAKHGLSRGHNGLEVYVMCEIPSNVLMAEEFARIFDGFSIGSNDLTQLALGVDRDSGTVAHIFDERDPAVKRMICEVIAKAKAAGRKIGICGQAPSDYPDFAKFLVDVGIDSISLNPDAVLKTLPVIAEAERDTGFRL